jgi:uncharacterized coiled-coil protein SlyX
MDNPLAERLDRIESHVAHLERQYEQLNEVLVEQSRLVSRLQKELVKASQTVEKIEIDRIRSNDQKPPHYNA